MTQETLRKVIIEVESGMETWWEIAGIHMIMKEAPVEQERCPVKETMKGGWRKTTAWKLTRL